VYSLSVNGSGGVRVWVDGKQMMDEWNTDNAAATPNARTAKLEFDKGKGYGLKVEFVHTAAQAAQNALPGAATDATGPSLVWENTSVNTIPAALEAAKAADVVVAVVGLTAELEGEEMQRAGMPEGFKGGDRTVIDLPKDEEALIEALKTSGKPLVMVLMAGSSVAVNWAKANANAILDAWYPGEEGGTAVARTLAGVNNPAGRLPVTFYKSLSDLPPFEDYSMKGRTYRYFAGEPLYPFGYGLSYSKFAYSNAKATPGSLTAGAPLVVEADIRNTSGIAGDEVAQLYVQFPNVPGAPLRALRGFQRVNIPAGQTAHVRFALDPRDLSMVNESGDRLVAAGAYRIFVGGGQPGTGAPGMEAALTVQGESRLPR
jgi:beta-glucosidase